MTYWDQLVKANRTLTDPNYRVTMSIGELKRLIDRAEEHGFQLAMAVNDKPMTYEPSLMEKFTSMLRSLRKDRGWRDRGWW